MNYRKEIDGLRALAVVGVILNHIGGRWFSGGFLGVDVFFVISGYVVSGSLLRHASTNKISFLFDFYSRRIKRLLPVFLVVISASFLLINLFDPLTFHSSVKFALFGLSNLDLYLKSFDYFAEASQLNIYTQTWSLAVEEQFYLIYPLLFVCANFFHSRKRGVMTLVLLFSMVSLVGFIYAGPRDPMGSFYLTHLRFWQFGLGGLLLLLPKGSFRWFNRLFKREWLTSLVLLLLSVCLIFKIAPAYVSSVIVSFLTVFLLYLLELREGLVFKFLTFSFLRHLGKISYSLYLWHWVVLVIARLTVGVNLYTIPVVLALIYGLSILTYHFVESPFRKKNKTNSMVYSSAVAALSVVFLVTFLIQDKGAVDLYIGRHKNLPQRSLFVGLKGEECRWAFGEEFEKYKNLSGCVLEPKKRNGRTVFFTGDSHAEALGNTARSLNTEMGYMVNLKVHAGCLFPNSFYYTYEEMPAERFLECRKFNSLREREILSKVKKGDIVLNANFYGFYLNATPFSDNFPEVKKMDVKGREISFQTALRLYESELFKFGEKLKRRGAYLVVLAPLVQFERPIKECSIEWFNLKKKLNSRCDVKKDKILEHRYETMRMLNIVRGKLKTMRIWDPLSSLCPGETCSYYSRDGVGFYNDTDHLSARGATRVFQSLKGMMESIERSKD